ncbi:MAG: hypothetical protein H0Z37_05035 [Firmicutes bacterium]|nr:hypothetical protein [Bacillota bacterium]
MADLLARWRAQAGGDSGTGMFLDAGPRRMRVAGQWRPMPLLVSRNGRPARPGEPVGDRDVLEIRPPHTAAELHAALAAEQEEASGALAGTVWINGEEVPLQLKGELLRDGRPARPEEPLSADDTDETWEWRPGPPPTVGRLMDELGLARETEIRVVLNGAPLTVRLAASIRKNGAPARPDEPVEPGDRIEVRAESGVALYHILPHANLPGDAGPGRRLVLKVRGQEAGFTTPVRDGDDIVVAYE